MIPLCVFVSVSFPSLYSLTSHTIITLLSAVTTAPLDLMPKLTESNKQFAAQPLMFCTFAALGSSSSIRPAEGAMHSRED